MEICRVIRRYCWLGLVGLLVAVPPSAFADGFKAGIVDLQRVMAESKQGKKYMAEVRAEMDQLKASLDQDEAELKTLREEIERQGLVLSESARAEKEREYRDKTEAFRQKFQQSQRVLQKKDQDVTKTVLKELEKLIRNLGETQGYSLILERRQSFVLYSPESADLTDEVIRRYDKQAEGE